MAWLDRWLAYTAPMESPETFFLWGGIAVLGHVLGRRVWVEQQTFRLYPGQIMVVFVSESAVTRKSTAAQAAVDLLQYLPQERVNKLPNKLSPAVLIDALRRLDSKGEPLPCVGLVYARELGTFFTKESFAETLATHITDLNDAPSEWTYETHTSGRIVLTEPCIGMLGCTTPTGLAHEIPKVAQSAGFFGRLLIVYADQPKAANDLLDPLPVDQGLRAWIARDLLRIADLEGAMRFTPHAREWYREWYTNHVFATRRLVTTGQTDTGYMGRRHAHLLRVAMVLSVSQDSSRVIHEGHLDAARLALEAIEAAMPRAHVQLGASPLNADQERIIATLERHGEMNYRAIYKRLWRFIGDPERFRICLRSLVEASLLEETNTPEGKHYKLQLPKGRLMGRAMVDDDDLVDEPTVVAPGGVG